MEDSPGSHPGPQSRRDAGGSQAEPTAAPAEQGTEPPAAGSDPDDDNGWLPV